MSLRPSPTPLPRWHAVAFTCLALTLLAVPSFADSAEEAQGAQIKAEVPTADEIIRRANRVAYYQGQDGRARASLTVTDAKGRARNKEMFVLRKDMDDDDREQKLYVYFRQPADERGVTFLVWKYLDRDDDRWIYLPALDVQKRIAASDKRTSFVGSHFYYEDISGRNPSADRHELQEETGTYYVIRSVPKNPDQVEFDALTTWVHKESSIPVQVRYERQGEVYREVKIQAVKEVQGYMTLTKIELRDLASGGHSVIEYSDLKYDLGLPEELFSERYLRSPPQKYFP